jgi:hypothetical protein
LAGYFAKYSAKIDLQSKWQPFDSEALRAGMTQRVVGGQTFNLTDDAENRLVSVTGAATAAFDYDADGKQVKGTVSSQP